jgi:tetratricopeptide (TPR) repeat protein
MNTPAKIGCGLSASLVLALAGLVAFGVYQLQRDRRATVALQKAKSAIDQRDFDGAIALFDGVLQMHLPPAKAAVAYYGRGYAKNEKFKYDDAIRDFSEALRFDSAKVDAYWGRGYAYQRNDEFDKALVDYAEALRRNPNLGRVYFNRGLVYLQRKEWAKAALDFSEAIRCEPGNLHAYLDRGSALLELGDLDGALASLDASISINPLVEAYKVRAAIHRRRGDEERARNDELKMAQLAAANVAPVPSAPVFGSTSLGADLLRRARMAAEIGRHDEAIDLCNQALGITLSPFLASRVFMTCGNATPAKTIGITRSVITMKRSRVIRRTRTPGLIAAMPTRIRTSTISRCTIMTRPSV